MEERAKSQGKARYEEADERRSPSKGRLDQVLRRLFSLGSAKAKRWIGDGKVFVEGVRCLDPAAEVHKGERVELRMNAPKVSRSESFGARLVYADDALCVLDKPAGLLSAPLRGSDEAHALKAAGRLCRGARRPRIVHRLDRDTSGLLLFARTIPAARALQVLIEERGVERLYRSVVRGAVKLEHAFITSRILRDRGDGYRGSVQGSLQVIEGRLPPLATISESTNFSDTLGLRAVSELWCYKRGEVSALELKLHTGRTHQLRIHLSELGHPLLGERVYGRERKSAPRQALHAARLSFPHPFSGEQLSFESAWPDDLARLPVPAEWRSERRPRAQKRHPHAPTLAAKRRGKG